MRGDWSVVLPCCALPCPAVPCRAVPGEDSVMSGSTPPPPPADSAGSEGGCLPPEYKHFQPEEHGLDRGFRLTAFSELKG